MVHRDVRRYFLRSVAARGPTRQPRWQVGNVVQASHGTIPSFALRRCALLRWSLLMPTQIGGQPGALISGGFPTTKVVTNISNTSPIVVTTSTAHGLHTGDLFRVFGTGIQALDNLGVWRAGAVTLTTVALHFLDTGDPSNALGAAVAGTLSSFAWGSTMQIPSDGPGNPRSATSVNVAFEALAARTAYLLYRMGGHIEPHLRFIQYRGAAEDDTNEDDSVFWTWGNVAYVDGSGTTQLKDTFYCETGDILDIELNVVVTIAGGDAARLRVLVDDNAGPSFIVPAGGRFSIAAGVTRASVRVVCRDTIGIAGSRTVKVQGKTSAGNAMTAIGAGALFIRHFRSVP